MLEIKTDYDNITVKVDSGTAPLLYMEVTETIAALLGVMSEKLHLSIQDAAAAVGSMLSDAIQHQRFKSKENVNDRMDPVDLSDH